MKNIKNMLFLPLFFVLVFAKTDGYKKQISPATLNKEIQTLKRYFEYCVDMDWIIKNPFS